MIFIISRNCWRFLYNLLVAGSNNAYNLQQQKTNAAKNKEKEEEKRRLQAEMRRREQELLNKIKEQQKMLESMKHEKSKVKLTFSIYLIWGFIHQIYKIYEIYHIKSFYVVRSNVNYINMRC